MSQFYATLDIAFARIFDDRPGRDMVGRTLRGVLLVVGIIALVIALFIIGALSALFRAIFPDELATLQFAGDIIASWPFLLVLGVLTVGTLYRVVPAGTPKWRALWLPAVLVGVVVVVLSQLFMRLVPLLVGAAAVAGTLATAFIALAWLSFTYQTVLYGASWVRVRDDRMRGVEPAGSALTGPAAPAEPGVGGE